jgi:hypothetical protein
MLLFVRLRLRLNRSDWTHGTRIVVPASWQPTFREEHVKPSRESLEHHISFRFPVLPAFNLPVAHKSNINTKSDG